MDKIRVADYIINRLSKHYGVKHIFIIPGGGAMHLNDAIAKCKDIKYIGNHHEQACAIAAEGYARITNKLAVVNCTTGPGATNCITGVLGQWTDSIPVLYISGQVKRETLKLSYENKKLRQLGDQEVDIISIVKPITKFAITIFNPLDVKAYLDMAISTATTGRPGPVWLDIPLDVQGALINEKDLCAYEPFAIKPEGNSEIAIRMLMQSKRPVIIAGRGIRIANAKNEFNCLVNKLKIPVLTTFNNYDIIEEDNNYYIGRIGTIGQRAGNFALQNADLIISIGSRNNIRQISYNWSNFAKNAKKIVVDIDEAELKKETLIPDLSVHMDAKDFINELINNIQLSTNYGEWLRWCIQRKTKYSVSYDHGKMESEVHPYYFIEMLSQTLKEKDIIISANGTPSIVLFQMLKIKRDQRVICNSGCASMGYDLPAAIGACIANNNKQVICLAGDGSFQMNIQELQTIVHNKLPIKIFYFNNNGYISMKQTQDNFFEGRRIVCDKNSGVSFPNIEDIAMAYDIIYHSISKHQNITKGIKATLNCKEAVICEVKLGDYIFAPKLSSQKLPDGKMISKSLEDMFPFLSKEELESNMIKETK